MTQHVFLFLFQFHHTRRVCSLSSSGRPKMVEPPKFLNALERQFVKRTADYNIICYRIIFPSYLKNTIGLYIDYDDDDDDDDDDNEKSAQRRRKHCALAVVRRSQKISPRRRPLPGGAGRPKFNQLEVVTTFTYRPSLFGDDRCTQFRFIVVTYPQTNTQIHKQTGPITIHCAAKLSAQCNNRVSIAPSWGHNFKRARKMMGAHGVS